MVTANLCSDVSTLTPCRRHNCHVLRRSNVPGDGNRPTTTFWHSLATDSKRVNSGTFVNFDNSGSDCRAEYPLRSMARLTIRRAISFLWQNAMMVPCWYYASGSGPVPLFPSAQPIDPAAGRRSVAVTSRARHVTGVHWLRRHDGRNRGSRQSAR
jgi:hypothetical protein